MGNRFRLQGTTPGLVTGLLFVPSAAGAAVSWATDGGTAPEFGGAPALWMLAGSLAVIVVQLAVFGRRPRVVEVMPGGDGLRLHALFRRWDLPGARVTAVRSLPVGDDAGGPGEYCMVSLLVDLPAPPRPALPGQGGEPPPQLMLKLPTMKEPALERLRERLRAIDPQACGDGHFLVWPPALDVPEAFWMRKPLIIGFFGMILLGSAVVTLWCFAVVAGVAGVASLLG